MQLKRKLYRRGNSHETTIPKPLLFNLDLAKQHDIYFTYDSSRQKWYLEFQERGTGKDEPVQEKDGRIPKHERFQIHTY
ncbi:MAG: hypothetical protein V1743_02185 [Nanoarchaeota archaeon]